MREHTTTSVYSHGCTSHTFTLLIIHFVLMMTSNDDLRQIHGEMAMSIILLEPAAGIPSNALINSVKEKHCMPLFVVPAFMLCK